MRAGFALPAVLAITGVVSLAMVAAAAAVGHLGRETRSARQATLFTRSALDQEARAVFLLLTRPRDSAALSLDARGTAWTLDGARLSLSPGLDVSLQDESGLININALPVEALPRLFLALGATPHQARLLAVRAADHLDADDQRRPGGAEAADQRRLRLPPPPNGPFVDRVDLLGLPGAREAFGGRAWRDVRARFVAEPGVAQPNVNAAPAETLVVVYGLSPEAAARAVARRRTQPFGGLEDLGRAAGRPLVGDAERDLPRPGPRLRFGASSPNHRYTSRLVLAPRDAEQPFHIEDRTLDATPLLPSHAGRPTPR